MTEPGYFFIRVNGETIHNDPDDKDCFKPGSGQPRWPEVFFNYVDLCLRDGFIRIGWPGTGSLHGLSTVPVETKCYGKLEMNHRRYLDEFRRISIGSVVLMPDKARPGVLYVGKIFSVTWRPRRSVPDSTTFRYV